MNQFWFDDVSVLVNQDHMTEFIPTKEMSQNDKLNALMRFAIYLSIILMLMTANINYLFISIVVGIITYVIHINNVPEIKDSNTETKKEYVEPSKDNLFGNILESDLKQGKTEEIPKEEYNKQFDELVNKDAFHEQEHLFKDKMSLRTFYKAPNSFDSQSRENFMKWCYKPPLFKDNKNYF